MEVLTPRGRLRCTGGERPFFSECRPAGCSSNECEGSARRWKGEELSLYTVSIYFLTGPRFIKLFFIHGNGLGDSLVHLTALGTDESRLLLNGEQIDTRGLIDRRCGQSLSSLMMIRVRSLAMSTMREQTGKGNGFETIFPSVSDN